ncbi:MAG: hypothetical protein ACFFKA_01080 [Candidatus Thorarchaeota archaeon]
MSKISKILEINNCNKELLTQALYSADFWEKITPTKTIYAKFIAPNVLYSKFTDEINIVKLKVEMEGELVLLDKGEEEGKGRVIEFNIRNSKEVRELEGRIRVKYLSSVKSKVGVFIENFALEDNFLKLIGSAAEFILQTKITEFLRNLEKFCKSSNLKNFL